MNEILETVPDPEAGQIAISALFRLKILMFGNHKPMDKVKIAKEIFQMIHETHCFHGSIGEIPCLEKWKIEPVSKEEKALKGSQGDE